MVTQNPFHGSGRAFAHPALTLGGDAKAVQGIKDDTGEWEATSGRSGVAAGQAMNAPNRLSRPLPVVITCRMPHRHPVHSTGTAGEKARFRHGLLDFPMRPQTGSVWGERGISRFPREMLPYHS